MSIRKMALSAFVAVVLAAAAACPAGASTAFGRSWQTAGGVEAQPVAKACYSALDDDAGVGVNSQNYEDKYASYDDAAATDVTLTKKCVVKQVVAPGHHCYGPAPSETVTFYKDRKGLPGKVISKQTVEGQDNFGYFTLTVKPVTLAKGTYWVSIVANMDLATYCQWAWEMTSDHSGSDDAWQNPAGGFDICPTWGDVVTCTLSDAADLMIQLS